MELKSDKKDGSFNSYPENEVFEFWKIVKDRLIDLCYKTGLPLPACLIRLRTELKLKILELLPGVDIARMECVCSEMREHQEWGTGKRCSSHVGRIRRNGVGGNNILIHMGSEGGKIPDFIVILEDRGMPSSL
ncbi:hypothetical protein V6N13_090297 [Hibiscus sabdariffa]|uniref:F-box domain-containing protein n=1 Tax=Hibiscus sabdariffa TaxID=183260 RepID=A0ABR2C0S1_9ROSI